MPSFKDPTLVGDDCLYALSELKGHTITNLRRIWYVLGDEVHRHEGWIEVTSQDLTLLVKGASDGTRLGVLPGPWTDPFALPLSPDNVAYLARFGTLRAFDVSGDDPYRLLIGEVVLEVKPSVNEDGQIFGVAVSFRGHELLA